MVGSECTVWLDPIIIMLCVIIGSVLQSNLCFQIGSVFKRITAIDSLPGCYGACQSRTYEYANRRLFNYT